MLPKNPFPKTIFDRTNILSLAPLTELMEKVDVPPVDGSGAVATTEQAPHPPWLQVVFVPLKCKVSLRNSTSVFETPSLAGSTVTRYNSEFLIKFLSLLLN